MHVFLMMLCGFNGLFGSTSRSFQAQTDPLSTSKVMSLRANSFRKAFGSSHLQLSLGDVQAPKLGVLRVAVGHVLAAKTPLRQLFQPPIRWRNSCSCHHSGRRLARTTPRWTSTSNPKKSVITAYNDRSPEHLGLKVVESELH